MPEYKKKNKVNELYKEKLDTHFYTTDLYKESKKQTNKQTINQVYALLGIYYLNDIQPTT